MFAQVINILIDGLFHRGERWRGRGREKGLPSDGHRLRSWGSLPEARNAASRQRTRLVQARTVLPRYKVSLNLNELLIRFSWQWHNWLEKKTDHALLGQFSIFSDTAFIEDLRRRRYLLLSSYDFKCSKYLHSTTNTYHFLVPIPSLALLYDHVSDALRANVQPGILFNNGQSTAKDDYSQKEVHASTPHRI